MFRYFFILAFAVSLIFGPEACFADAPPSYATKTDEITFAGGDVAFDSKCVGGDSEGILCQGITALSKRVHKSALSWAKPLKETATVLFYALMGISLVWTLIELGLRQGTVGEIFAELAKNFIFFGLFLCVLNNADSIAGIIYNSFADLGANASGEWSNNAGSIGGRIVEVGLKYLVAVGKYLLTIYKSISGIGEGVTALLSLPFAFLCLAIGLFTLFVCALMCVKVLVAEATLWIIMYGGIFILGFGASKWTKDIAISYLKTVLAMCFAYFGMLLVANILVGILDDNIEFFEYAATTKAKHGSIDTAEWFFPVPDFIMVVIMYFIMDKIPTIFSSMINGMHFTAGPASFKAAGAAMAMGASRIMMGKQIGDQQAAITGYAAKGIKGMASVGAGAAKGAFDAIKKLGKKGGGNKQAGETQAKDGETAAQNKESQEKSEPPAPAKMKQDDAGSEAKSQSQAQTVSQTKDSSSQSNKSDVINLTKEDYTVTNSAADGQKPAGSSEGSASSEQAQLGYFEQLEKEIASNAEKKVQESSSPQNDSKQTFTAQDANRYKSFYAAKKDFPQLERSEWSKATKDSYKNFTAKDASRYEDIYAARKDYPHLDLAAWQNARIKSTLDKAADAAKKKDN